MTKSKGILSVSARKPRPCAPPTSSQFSGATSMKSQPAARWSAGARNSERRRPRPLPRTAWRSGIVDVRCRLTQPTSRGLPGPTALAFGIFLRRVVGRGFLLLATTLAFAGNHIAGLEGRSAKRVLARMRDRDRELPLAACEGRVICAKGTGQPLLSIGNFIHPNHTRSGHKHRVEFPRPGRAFNRHGDAYGGTAAHRGSIPSRSSTSPADRYRCLHPRWAACRTRVR